MAEETEKLNEIDQGDGAEVLYANRLAQIRDAQSVNEGQQLYNESQNLSSPSLFKYLLVLGMFAIPNDMIDGLELTGILLILSWFVSLFLSALTALVMWFTDSELKRVKGHMANIEKYQKTAAKVATKVAAKLVKFAPKNPTVKVTAGAILEAIPFISIMPWSIISVLLAYWDERKVYKDAKRNAAEILTPDVIGEGPEYMPAFAMAQYSQPISGYYPEEEAEEIKTPIVSPSLGYMGPTLDSKLMEAEVAQPYFERSEKEATIYTPGIQKSEKKIEEEPGHTIIRPSTQRVVDLRGIIKPQEEAPQMLRISSDLQEQKESHEYLEKVVFAKFGLTPEAESKTLAEASENKRDIVKRSFQNLRDTLQSLYELDTEEGRIDKNAMERERQKMTYEIMSPVLEEKIKQIQPRLVEYHIDISPETLGFIREQTDLDNLRRNLNKIKYQLESAIEQRVDNKIETSLMQTGEYRGITIPTDQQLGDEDFMERRSDLLRSVTREEKQRLMSSVGFEDWINNTSDSLSSLIPTVPTLGAKDFKTRKTKEVLTEEIEHNIERAKNTGFLSINIRPDKLEQVLNTGQFKDIFALDKKELEEMQREFGRGDKFYFNQREVTEKALGVYDPSRSTIYGTYASENGVDEKRGGAEIYGNIFLKIRPGVDVTFIEGDSMSGGGGEAVDRKMKRSGINRLDYAKHASARQIAPEHVGISKALLNIEKSKNEALTNQGLTSIDYIEAHIKGLKTEDIESINIPKSVLMGADKEYKKFLDKFMNDPRWKNKIKIINDK